MTWPIQQENLSLEKFAIELLETKDLDPVYFGTLAIKNKAQLKRWLVAYWCFYHCGFACYASEFLGDKFWALLLTAAENKLPNPMGERWPRSAERRHFRGSGAVRAIQQLGHAYKNKPERFVDYLSLGTTQEEVSKRVLEHYLFGPWIAFKAADMLERCLRVPVHFPEEVLMYKEPLEGALRGYQERYPNKSPESLNGAVAQISKDLGQMLEKYKAPPYYDRKINVQELETIYCKFKSHRNGHYLVGKDIREVRHGLQGWNNLCETAHAFERALPPLV